jgi:hypothetical protein
VRLRETSTACLGVGNPLDQVNAVLPGERATPPRRGDRAGLTVRVLLVALEGWYSTARLPGALARAGFEVGILCEPGSLAGRSRYVTQKYRLDVPALHRGRIESVVASLAAFAPDLVVPGDERGLRILGFLLKSPELQKRSDLRRVIEHSIGRFCRNGHGGERLATLDLAESLGIAVAKHARAGGFQDVLAFGRQQGWPLYLKRDHTYGGQGVHFCLDATVAKMAHDELSRGHRLDTLHGLWRRARRFCETLRNGHDPLALPIGVGGISVERGVPGAPAYYTGVAIGGRVLAGFSAEVLAFEPPNGPSTRVSLHRDAEMDRAASRLVEALGFAGFFGLDFIRRPEGDLVFLEFNGRPTTVCHLGGLVSADLCAALFAAETGRAAQIAVSSAPTPAEARVALFPQDWIRDAMANDRHHFLLDIPGDDPPLLEGLNQRLPPIVDRAEIERLSRRAVSGETANRGAIE